MEKPPPWLPPLSEEKRFAWLPTYLADGKRIWFKSYRVRRIG